MNNNPSPTSPESSLPTSSSPSTSPPTATSTSPAPPSARSPTVAAASTMFGTRPPSRVLTERTGNIGASGRSGRRVGVVSVDMNASARLRRKVDAMKQQQQQQAAAGGNMMMATESSHYASCRSQDMAAACGDIKTNNIALSIRSRKTTEFGGFMGEEATERLLQHEIDMQSRASELEEAEEASWGEVCTACCCHTPREWGVIFVGVFILCFFLYFFLFGLELMGTSAKVLGGCTAGSLMGGDLNPVAALLVAMLVTALIQSSSTTTSIIVSLVGGGMDTETAIYMIMGANIGTTITNIIVALGQMGNGDQLERAFAGATVHDIFNVLAVAILFPIEVGTHYLYHLTKALLPAETRSGDSWDGPVKKIVAPLSNLVLIANKNLMTDVANGDRTCESYYPVTCEGNVESYATCNVGLIACDKKTNKCPIFFQNGATKKDDSVSGGVCLVLALVIIIVCLIGLVSLLQRMLKESSSRIIYKATNINVYLAMLIGCAVTFLVQSSSITTSTLTPLVGLGVIRLEQMMPLTLGANIGTTGTALLAASVSDKIESLQVALAHLFFNITAIIIWYPIPFMRRVPLGLARKCGKATRIWRGVPFVYILIVFFVVPLILFGLSALFEQGGKGFTALGVFFVIVIVLGIAYFVIWLYFRNGRSKITKCMKERERKRVAMKTLPDALDFLMDKVSLLDDILVDDEDDDIENGSGNDRVHTEVSELSSGFPTTGMSGASHNRRMN